MGEDWSIDGPPNEDEWILTGPSAVGDFSRASTSPYAGGEIAGSAFPGDVDHTTAAYGGGGVGLVLMGLIGLIKRRRARRRMHGLDDEV